MDSKKMIELIKIKEEGIIALKQYDRENGRLCSYTTVCQDMAKKFIQLHSKAFDDEQIQRDVIDYLADCDYSEFSDALYQQLVYTNDNQDQQELLR